MSITPLEALRRRPMPITDVVYGEDHPSNAPPQRKDAAAKSGPERVGAGSLVKDRVPGKTRRSLELLLWRLQKQEREAAARKKGK